MSAGRRIAILIGNGEFPEEPSLSRLRCPQRDVEGLAAALTAQEIGLFADPLIFVNQPHHTVLRAINRVFRQASRQDQILIYYSGHGKQDSAGGLHLATVDTDADALETTSIAVDSFRRLIDNYSCKQVALILDCCFAGAVGKDFLKGNVSGQLQQVSDGRGIYVLTASTATQTAREKEGDEYSLFTKHILHGLAHGEADQDDDGLVSMDDLYEYVRAHVPREAPQHPMKWALGIHGGEFVIARAVKSYSQERLRAFREQIKSLDSYLPDDVFDQAIQVIRANQPKQDKEFLSLLEVLGENRVTVGEFVSRWLKLGLPFSVQHQRELAAQRQRELEEQRRQEEQERLQEQARQREQEAQRQRELEAQQQCELEELREREEEDQRQRELEAQRQREREAQRQHDKRYLFESHDASPIHLQTPTAIPAQNPPASKADEPVPNDKGPQPISTDGRSRRNLFIFAGLIVLVIGGLVIGATTYLKQQAEARDAQQQAQRKSKIEKQNQKEGLIGNLRDRIAEIRKRVQAVNKQSLKGKRDAWSESLNKLSLRLDGISNISSEQYQEINQACDEIGKELSKIEEEVNSVIGLLLPLETDRDTIKV
jgi:hypothetical protein